MMFCLNNTNYHKSKGKIKYFFPLKIHTYLFLKQRNPRIKLSRSRFSRTNEVCSFIQQCIGDNISNHIMNETYVKAFYGINLKCHKSDGTINNPTSIWLCH